MEIFKFGFATAMECAKGLKHTKTNTEIEASDADFGCH